MFYSFCFLNGKTGVTLDRYTTISPKFRSGITGMIVSEDDTEALGDMIGEEGIHLLVENGFLIEEGEWKKTPDTRSWQELCEYGEVIKAVRKFREEHDSTLREARDAIENYKAFLKNKYGRKEK